MTKPTLNGWRAKQIFILLSDDSSELGVNLDRALAAHVAGRNTEFYAEIGKAKRNQAFVADVIRLLSQGRYAEAERMLGIEGRKS